jgi:hypothetical protein
VTNCIGDVRACCNSNVIQAPNELVIRGLTCPFIYFWGNRGSLVGALQVETSNHWHICRMCIGLAEVVDNMIDEGRLTYGDSTVRMVMSDGNAKCIFCQAKIRDVLQTSELYFEVIIFYRRRSCRQDVINMDSKDDNA